MDTKFTNSENSKASDPLRLLLSLLDKINVKWSDKYVVLWNLIIYYAWKNVKKSYKNNKLKISSPIWNEEFELHLLFYKQSIFDPRPENCSSFPKNRPKKLFRNCLVDGLLTSIV